jgi:enoyl-CoA hydratase/3-hydroxyacyl-CoA dehydrogenase
LAPIVEESRKKAGLFKGQPPKLTPEEIIQFIFFPVVNEGCRVIDEGIVDKPSDLDVATVMSMGFPAYRSVNPAFFECVLQVICILTLSS